ncbi:MAG: metallophosphoesterase [Verrucomicrobia bacterium]|nr:metallophosphoesterase [Verrucomicrobiota bacterium]
MSQVKPLRIAAVSDIHYTKTSKGALQELFVEASGSADVLLICGDFTDYGLPEEAKVVAEDIKAHVRIPVIGVVGNHDFESGKKEEVQAIIEEAGVKFLDGDTAEVLGVGFAGVCGFGGGFGQQMLNAWGEPLIKAFVQEAVEHSLRLEKALTRLTMDKRIVLLHYSPIRDTVAGENPELFPFLGASRFEATIDQFKVSAVFHGHAHHGTLEGKIAKQVPVFNVALPVLSRSNGRKFLFYEV